MFQKPTLPGLWRTQDRLGDYSNDPGPRQWLRPGGGKLGRHLRVKLAQLESLLERREVERKGKKGGGEERRVEGVMERILVEAIGGANPKCKETKKF